MAVAGILVAGLTNTRVIPSVGAHSGGSSLSGQHGSLAARLITARGVIVNGVATDGFFDNRLEIADAFLESQCGIASAGDGVYLLGAFPSGVAGNEPSLSGAFPSGVAAESGDGGAFPSGVSANSGGAFPSGSPSLSGAFPSGVAESGEEGAFPSGSPTTNGAFPSGYSGGDAPELSGAFPSGSPSLSGAFPSGRGTFVGGSVQVFGGVLEGDNIHVANGVIRGRNLRLVGAYVSAACPN